METNTHAETFPVDLPTSVKPYLEAKIASGECSSASEYVLDLIKRDRQRDLEEKLLESIADGEKGLGIEWTKEESEKLLKEHREHMAARKREKR